MKVCPYCRKPVKETDKVCGYCKAAMAASDKKEEKIKENKGVKK